MNVVYNEQITCFDVDETLVLWNPENPMDAKVIVVRCPYSDSLIYLTPHARHIELLKSYKGRGRYVRVWSAGGAKWAEAVVKALSLENYVDSVETKPNTLIDDLPVQEIFPVRLYLPNV